MLALKITTVGNSTGVVLPKEALARLHVEKGDTLYLVETKDGYRITPYNEEVIRQIALAEKIAREDRDVLRALAK
jgi:putative addiction module antidote